MILKKFKRKKHCYSIFLPSIFMLFFVLCLSIGYSSIAARLNISGEGRIEINKDIDYYYFNGYFYTDQNCNDVIISKYTGSRMTSMADAVNQIWDGRTIHMMSGYYTSSNETIIVSGKSVIIKRYKDNMDSTKTFKKGPMFTSTTDLKISVGDSTSALVIDGNNINLVDENSNESDDLKYIGAIYSPSGNLNLEGYDGTNNLIIQNHTGISGGIIKENGNSLISNCDLSNNTAVTNGSILRVKSSYNSSGIPGEVKFDLINCNFKSNNSSDYLSEVISFDSTCDPVKINESQINKIMDVRINNCNVSNNLSTAFNFSALKGGSEYCSYKIQNCSIFNNKAVSTDKYNATVGGINFNQVGGILENCTITGNKSLNDYIGYNAELVGGVNVSDIPISILGKTIIKNNTINDNVISNLNFHSNSLIINDLSEGSEIGLSSYLTVPTENNPLIISSKGNSSSILNYFFSDDKTYNVVLNSESLELVIPATDYYYSNGYFFRDSSLSKYVTLSDRSKLTKMSDSVNQISSGYIIYMLSKYEPTNDETVVVPRSKIVTIKRTDDFIDNPLFKVTSNFKIDASDSTSTITIDGNNIDLKSANVHFYGGCFRVTSGGKLTLNGSYDKENFFVKNNKIKYGGGAGITEDSQAVIENVTFTNNHAQTGASICNDGNLILIKCKITNSSATNTGGGINVGLNSQSTILKECTLSDGCKAKKGGAINIDSTSSVGSVVISSCGIFDNEASESGGGIAIRENCLENMQLKNTRIENNIATYGGGIHAKSNFELYDKIIIKNNKNTNNIENNLYLSNGITISTENLTGGSSIGISSQSPPTSSAPITISGSGKSTKFTSYFFSDDTNYELKFINNILKLILK